MRDCFDHPLNLENPESPIDAKGQQAVLFTSSKVDIMEVPFISLFFEARNDKVVKEIYGLIECDR